MKILPKKLQISRVRKDEWYLRLANSPHGRIRRLSELAEHLLPLPRCAPSIVHRRKKKNKKAETPLTPPSPASLGILGTLPMELIIEVTQNLDVTTLCRLRQVCWLAKELIETLHGPTFIYMQQLNQKALFILRFQQMLGSFPATRLIEALKYGKCELCDGDCDPDSGPYTNSNPTRSTFIHADTCQRTCYHCSPSTWDSYTVINMCKPEDPDSPTNHAQTWFFYRRRIFCPPLRRRETGHRSEILDAEFWSSMR